MSHVSHEVHSLYVPQRIDAYLARALDGLYSRESIKKALESGKLTLNGKSAKPRETVSNGDRIEGEVEAREAFSLAAEKIPISVIYEDASLMIVDKPVGMVVHPGAGNKSGTLVNALLGRGGSLSSAGDKDRPGIVHRIDKDTSGVLVVAKNNASHRALQQQFAERSLSKTYHALVKGRVEFEEGRLDLPIGHDPKIRHKMAVSHEESAREARTFYKVLKRFRHATFLEVKIETGRTHQIRVHMKHLGHPVVGDKLYGNPEDPSRLMLHASKIEFEHPKTGKIVAFESPLPVDFMAVVQGQESGSR